MQPKLIRLLTLEVAQKKEDATEMQQESVALKAQVEEAEVTTNGLEAKREKALVVIGNLVHDSVPVDNDEVRFTQCGWMPWHQISLE